MKFKYHRDKKLLTSIRISYHRISNKLRDEGKVKTKLFRFKNGDRYRDKFRNAYNQCLHVKVLATGEVYVVTQRCIFGYNEWTLWKIRY